MKKIFFIFLALSLLVPLTGMADIVKCGDPGEPDCTINDLVGPNGLIYNIIDFLVTQVVTTLAVIFLIIGGAMMVMSAGDPGKMATGKKIIIAAIIGTALAYGALAIINFIMSLIGYTGAPV